jgi:CRP-like cAMP-binding protein
MHYSNPYIELCLEGNSSPFKELNQKEKESIDKHHIIISAKKGDFIFKEGDKSRGLAFLASGKIKLFKIGVGGREQILKMAGAKELIGFRNLFTENIWSLSAKAIEESNICVLGKQSLFRIIKKNPDLSLSFMKILSEELWYSYNRTVSLTQKHVRGRLVESLLMLADIYGYDEDGKTIQVALSRDDIAHLSNMTTSNAIRTLSNLATEGLIELKGRRIKLLDRTSLRHISESG